ncbi:MAG: histidine kinase [Chitinophagales bacterium]|jgi:ligand-binding sensor domain-containing protein|nr:histidine kinase [Sphingobacteriales bacterium]
MRNKLLVFIFLIGQNVLGQLSSKDFVIKQYTIDDGLPSNSIYSCALDSSGYLWFGTDNGLSRFDGKHFRNFNESHGLLDNMNLGVSNIKGNIVSLGFKGATILKNTSNHYIISKILLENKNDPKIKFFGEDLYFEKNGIIGLLDFKSQSVLRIKVSDTSSLKKYFKNDFKLFSRYNSQLNQKFSLGNYSIILVNANIEKTENVFLCKNNNVTDSLLFKNRLGFYLFEKSKRLLLVNSSRVSILGIVNDKLTIVKSIDLPGYNINSCLQIDENTYIMNTIDKGFFIFQKKQGLDSLAYAKYQDFSDWLNKHKQSRGVKCYESIGRDTFFVGTSNGVAQFDAKKRKIIEYFFHTRTYSLHVLNSKELYIGSISGLYLHDFFTKKAKKLDLGAASDSKINSITSDQDGSIWISAASKGVYVINKQNKVVLIYNEDKGLATNDIYKIQVDHKNRKWFSSNKGLQILDDNRFYRVDKHDGLLSNEVLDFELHGDTAWISTPIGKQSYVYQKPNTRINLPIYFNSYALNNITTDSLPSQLGPNDNKIEFNYIGIYYPNLDNIEYKYKLIKDGKETPWQTTREAKLIFEKLQAGDYELLIKAFHNNYPEVYSKVLSKKFYIKPYFYQTFWFYTLIITLIIGSIFYFFYRWNKGKLRSLIYQRELGKLKLEALKAEMNPHFIFNVLNTIKEAMMDGDFETSQNLLDRLAKIIRQALYNSKRDFLSLQEEIHFIEQYVELERARFNKNFEFIKKLNSNVLHYEVPTMLLQPFIENAIRHGKIGQLNYQGKLYFEVSETDKDLIIIHCCPR